MGFDPKAEAAQYTFGKRDYMRFMFYDHTDQHRGRRHVCPICGARVWSCWANADKHWQNHKEGTDDDL